METIKIPKKYILTKTNIKDTKNLEKIQLSGDIEVLICKGIDNVPFIKSVKILDISNCISIIKITKEYSNLKQLYCNKCKSLQSLPEVMNNLEILEIAECKSLFNIPECPNIKKIVATNSNILTIPNNIHNVEQLMLLGTLVYNVPQYLNKLKCLEFNESIDLDTYPEIKYFKCKQYQVTSTEDDDQ